MLNVERWTFSVLSDEFRLRVNDRNFFNERFQ
jgi:hypothetical protein